MKRIRLLLLICSSGLILALILYYFRGPIYGQLDAWRLVPRPERFTELYFENPSALPAVPAADGQVAFQFTIHNLEGAETAYSYRVYFAADSGLNLPIDENTAVLASGASQTVAESYNFRQFREPGRVVVRLLNPPQEIDFLINRN